MQSVLLFVFIVPLCVFVVSLCVFVVLVQRLWDGGQVWACMYVQSISLHLSARLYKDFSLGVIRLPVATSR